MNLRCPRCKTPLRVPDELAGKAVRCKACNLPFKIPAPSKEPEAPAPGRALDVDSLEAIEGGEALVAQGRRRRVSIKEAQEAAEPEAPRQRDPHVRICPHCGTEARVPDLYTEVLCKQCDQPIPAAIEAEHTDARYYDSLAGRMSAPVTFYTGFGSAVFYPLPALASILLGMAVALGVILAPVSAILLLGGAASLNPISEQVDFSWIGVFVTLLFVLEGAYFSAVNYHILIDSIRTTASGGEQAPNLTWNPTSLGATFVGYIAIVLYYLVILVLLSVAMNGGRLVIPANQADLQRLAGPFGAGVLAIVTFMIPMHLIGLASSHTFDGLNPVRVVRSIAAVAAHYFFLFLIVVIYLGIYTGIMYGVIGWAVAAIFRAAREGIQNGVVPLATGLAAWAAVIGAGFFVTYSLGRILGLFVRTYREKLDFDL